MPGPLRERFEKKYRERYKEECGDDAAFAYDVVMLWATATALAGSTEPRAVCKQFEEISYRGICGTFYFNEEHWIYPYPEEISDPSLAIPHLFKQIQNLKNEIVFPLPYNTSTFQLPPWL